MQGKRQPYESEGHGTVGGLQELGPTSAKRQLQGKLVAARCIHLLLRNSLDMPALQPETDDPAGWAWN